MAKTIFRTKYTPEGKRFLEEVEKLRTLEVHVGFQAGKASEKDGTDIVEVAAINEFGTSTIPARPFVKNSFARHPDELKETCIQAVKMIEKGGTAEQAINMMGVFGKGLMQREIRDGNWKPNAPSTIRKKGSDRPLIDTGTMRQSVNYVVAPHKKGSDK